MRKLLLAATAVFVFSGASPGYAQQQLPEGASRQQAAPQQNRRGWGDFRGALRAIAGSRLDRAHTEREAPQGDQKKQKQH
ncbi:MAG TPA: hypothetical protein VFA53_06165 [Xanthobacteraceae bacterium]|nr:hypothetical protein [Xanthobacteraceae bacterium]